MAIERKVEPLQREVEALEVATRDTREQVQRLEEEMAVLAESAERYKASYGVAVRAAEASRRTSKRGKNGRIERLRFVASLRGRAGALEHRGGGFSPSVQLPAGPVPERCRRRGVQWAS